MSEDAPSTSTASTSAYVPKRRNLWESFEEREKRRAEDRREGGHYFLPSTDNLNFSICEAENNVEIQIAKG